MTSAIVHLKKADPVLAAIIDRVGPYKQTFTDPTFQNLARAIVFQQLNGRAATTIFDRLLAAAGEPLTPEGVLKLRPSRMRALGVSPQKTAYLRDLARHTRDGIVNIDRCATLENDDVIEHLTRVKGIGVWTSHMFLIFALRRPDVLPIGDYGIRAAMKQAYSLKDLPKPPEMEDIARAWIPWRSVACWYLWRSLDIKTPEQAQSQAAT